MVKLPVMNDHKEHISQYSAADIQRYAQGKLSAAEMHAMEKAALDDPFLADAMEGMQEAFTEHKESLVTTQLQQLQQQFNARTAPAAKVVAFKPFRYWQAAAAAAVVLIITGVWMFSLNKDSVAEKQAAPVIAKTEEQKFEPQPSPSSADHNNIGFDTDSVKPQKVTANKQTWSNNTGNTKVVTEKPKAEAPKEAPSSTTTTNNETAPVAASKPALNDADKYFNQLSKKDVSAEKKEAVAEHKAAAPPVVSDTSYYTGNRYSNTLKQSREREPETELITIARSEPKLKKATEKDKNLSGFIKGQVTDPFNNPVANAYVQVQFQVQKNNKQHLINNLTTDKLGYFKIPASDSVVDVAVNVNGYGTQNFTLQNTAALNQLQLVPANYSNYFYAPTVPVHGKNQLTNNYKFPSVMLYDAEPAYGWVAFGQYLEKNKVTPAGTENTTGNVIISFEVNKKGILSDYKIEQSLSKAHDEEAIRLIKQGPSWKLRSGRKARVTVMVKF